MGLQGVMEQCGGNLVLSDSEVYQATKEAVDAIERAYIAKVSKVSSSGANACELEYLAQITAKISVYEIASRAISAMANAAIDKRALVAGSAIAAIRQIQPS